MTAPTIAKFWQELAFVQSISALFTVPVAPTQGAFPARLRKLIAPPVGCTRKSCNPD